ncbi:FRG domain-containing protein [Thalassotalea atypica]|uniref:FRG domain-containing protein n=1 Tax=Thalassotalea atypica TaxID=2054316 RepID=UPI00257333DF|nr:FRG domain-containing protein [Thalassotalea atypica]
MKVSWEEYKSLISEHVKDGVKLVYRGQSDCSWKLQTTLHRTKLITNLDALTDYFEKVIPSVQESIEAWDGTRRDLSNDLDMAQFVAFLQHNGYPTPLLDWTDSPYVAAYFAFNAIDPFNVDNESAAIYSFDELKWLSKYEQIYDYKSNKLHVSSLRPSYRGNHKQMLQQGLFMYTNCDDIEQHIGNFESEPGEYLNKYELDISERPKIMNDLSLMGVSALQLTPSIEAVCKKSFENLAMHFQVSKRDEVPTRMSFDWQKYLAQSDANKPIKRD